MSSNNGYNRLRDEQSQYLTQHKSNPVHWWSYGPDALDEAQRLDKPIFLSIGYSSCHWCHVMAHESFEDQQTADFLNQHFVSIKVDREEHPDLDQYYQLACQAMNGHGGWPLSVFTTPDMKPFFIGTYFPKISKSAEIPTFMEVLQNLHKNFTENRENITQSAQQLSAAVAQPPEVSQKVDFEGHFPAPAAILNAIKNYADETHGGYGTAPKFPHFAFYEWATEQILEGMIPENLGKHIVLSVEKILMGGIFDQARGGIHRYSVDNKWLVPHFEKMLYDQAGLLRVLSKLSLIYPSPIIFDTIVQTLEYLRNEMLSEKGYFFAAQDADSEGVEGLYFTFTQDEFVDALKDFDEALLDHLEQIKKWFQISEKGNFERGLNVISLNADYRDEFYQPENWERLRKVKMALLEARRHRIPPATDNKGLASWNFMLASALIDVAQYCKIDSIANNAKELLRQSVPAIQETFVKHEENGTSQIVGSTTKDYRLPLFENYVNYAEFALRFYEVSGNEVLQQNGLHTIKYIFKEFYKDGMFFTRSLNFNDNELYENIHASIYDQSYKSSLATLLLLVRKWACASQDIADFIPKVEKTMETLTHLCLQNPIGFGESLRALSYPDIAFKKIEVPLNWLTSNQLKPFDANFSTRFVIVYHKRQDQKWQICNMRECELQGDGIEEFSNIFKAPNNEES